MSKEGLIEQRTDLEIIGMVAAGCPSAFAVLVKRYQEQLLRLCLRITRDLPLAEDVVQESLMKAYQKLGSFEGRSSFKSWLFRIAINSAKNRLRGHSPMSVPEVDDSLLSCGSIGAKRIQNDEIRTWLQGEVSNLPQRQQEALILRLYENLSFKEIAEIMECPYDTAKANFRHALLKIRESVQGKIQERGYDSFGDLLNEIELPRQEVWQ